MKKILCHKADATLALVTPSPPTMPPTRGPTKPICLQRNLSFNLVNFYTFIKKLMLKYCRYVLVGKPARVPYEEVY